VTGYRKDSEKWGDRLKSEKRRRPTEREKKFNAGENRKGTHK